VKVIPVDIKALIEEGDKWSKKYDQVVSGGEVVKD
jgi:hypothetical protein